MLKLTFLIIIPFAILFYSCSASTDRRYSTDSEEISSEKNKEVITEDDFDLTEFKTKIELPSESRSEEKKPLDLWFDYQKSDSIDFTKKTIVDTIPGYRVQVISTDNLDEANNVRSEIFFKTNEKAIYVLFEPPFYIVRVGDYKNFNDAKALSFKLNQMGFANSKIVNDLINIYK
jgi:SPOR domain